jgi:flagellar protein FlbB
VAEMRVVHPGVRIVVLLLLLGLLTLGGIVWFDYLGILDAKSVLAPLYGLLGMQKRSAPLDADDPNLLAKERLTKQADALALRQEDQDRRDAELTRRDKELTQRSEDLKDREAAVEAREKAFNEQVKAFDNRRVNLVQNSKYLTSMPPDKAVGIMKNMDDQDVIDIFRITEQEAARAGEDSPVAFWLSQMDAQKAATLQRKMARKSGG